jgi:hypothetical protein
VEEEAGATDEEVAFGCSATLDCDGVVLFAPAFSLSRGVKDAVSIRLQL